MSEIKTSVLIVRENVFANCWSSRGTGLLQMIIWRDRPLANDHPEGPAYCKWSSGGAKLLQMIICHPRHPSQICQDKDLISRTTCSCFWDTWYNFVWITFLQWIRGMQCTTWLLRRPDKVVCEIRNTFTLQRRPRSWRIFEFSSWYY